MVILAREGTRSAIISVFKEIGSTSSGLIWMAGLSMAMKLTQFCRFWRLYRWWKMSSEVDGYPTSSVRCHPLVVPFYPLFNHVSSRLCYSLCFYLTFELTSLMWSCKVLAHNYGFRSPQVDGNAYYQSDILQILCWVFLSYHAIVWYLK